MDANEIDIISAQTGKNKEVIKKIGSDTIDFASDLAEIVAEVPFIGAVVSLGKCCLGVRDYLFIRKLAKFITASDNIDEESKEKFVANLTDKDRKRISDYLINLLNVAEDEEKAELLGKIYGAAVLGTINIEEMLRLSSIVTKSFIADLHHLNEYIEENGDTSYISGNLNSLGLFEDCGNIYEISKDGWEGQESGPTKHKLNKIGIKLLDIINSD